VILTGSGRCNFFMNTAMGLLENNNVADREVAEMVQLVS